MTKVKKSKVLISALSVVLLCVLLGATIIFSASAIVTCESNDGTAVNSDISIPIEDLINPKVKYGDVDGDGEVGASDVLMLRKYMANYDYIAGTSTVEVQSGADVNGDGEVGASDVLILRKYMANYDYANGSSSVVLGPNS